MNTITESAPEVDSITDEGEQLPLWRRASLRVLGAVASVLATLYVAAGTASAAPSQLPEELTDGVTDMETNMLLIPGLLIGTAVVIGVAFLFVRVTPKIIRWVSARFG